jgi:hypothetical protein
MVLAVLNLEFCSQKAGYFLTTTTNIESKGIFTVSKIRFSAGTGADSKFGTYITRWAVSYNITVL